MVDIKIPLTGEENFATMGMDTERGFGAPARVFHRMDFDRFRGKGEQKMDFRQGRKAAAALLCAAALTTAASAAYTDTEGHWAESAIDRWSGEYGILRGYDDGSFRPDDTRALCFFTILKPTSLNNADKDE